ncbi:MAG: hypothetical protein PHQ98_02630 [Candidatus ainarchaeum sp.]|nr:hypothetical protein [Candidatus ainarchaeum sp.]
MLRIQKKVGFVQSRSLGKPGKLVKPRGGNFIATKAPMIKKVNKVKLRSYLKNINEKERVTLNEIVNVLTANSRIPVEDLAIVVSRKLTTKEVNFSTGLVLRVFDNAVKNSAITKI